MKEINKDNWLSFMPRFDTFLDIGAGKKNSEAWWVRHERSEVRIIGFEPVPQRYTMLINCNFPGELRPVAIGKEEGELEFFAVPASHEPPLGMRVLLPHHHSVRGTQKFTSKVFTLDQLNATMNFGPSFLWADVEGDEYNVLLGAEQMFKDGLIVATNLEVRPKPQPDGRCQLKEIEDFLGDYGFVAKYHWSHHAKPKPSAKLYDLVYVKE
jgi:FkbM family methyltransferase